VTSLRYYVSVTRAEPDAEAPAPEGAKPAEAPLDAILANLTKVKLLPKKYIWKCVDRFEPEGGRGAAGCHPDQPDNPNLELKRI